MKLRKRLLYDQPLCVICAKSGRVEVATERDHIVPLCRGGADTEENTQALCSSCHQKKTLEDIRTANPRLGCDENGFPLDPDHAWNTDRKAEGETTEGE